MSRIVGLNDLKKKNESKDEKKQQLFAGGLDQRGGGSGVNVLGPPRANDEDDDESDGEGLFGQIARGARQSGAVLDGSTSTNVSRRITLYQNGFTVDNGPLRDPALPENQRFIMELQSGRIPAELGNSAEIDVDMVNKITEDYVPPAYIAFSNANSLGSTAPVASGTFVLDPDIISTLPDAPEPIDESKPITTIQVRTLTGHKLKIRINQNATILQLATAIKCQFSTTDTYVLCAGYPPSDLESPDMTVAEAGLLNAMVTMRKV